jgi:hypothetical protein
MNRLSVVLAVLANFYLLSSCQKEMSDEIANITDSTGVWVVTHKFVNSTDTAFGNIPYTVKAGYFYDTLARTIVYNDTSEAAGYNTSISHTLNNYDQLGRLIKVAVTGDGFLPYSAVFSYNADGLLQKVNDNITFTWSQQGTDLVGHSSDPQNPGTPFSDGNKIFTLDADRRLKTRESLSADPNYGSQFDVVTRSAHGGVILRKSYGSQNGVSYMDSVIYTREENRPRRLSSFYELLGNGISWYSDYYGISFVPGPMFSAEYFEFEHSLCNKVEYYGTYIDNNGDEVTAKWLTEDFVMQYDSNDNPVKQTVYMNGEKVYEITYQWKKINWVN